MKNQTLKACFFLVITAFFPSKIFPDPPVSLEGWEMVFEDEFEGSSLDSRKWNPTYNWGHTHNHRAYCVAENVLVESGILKIKGEAKRHPNAPATVTSGGKTYSLDFTSGAIDSRNKFSVKYGYIEGRFKMPSQRGTWPAFWMLQDGWPPEIDIFEVPHRRDQHHYYLHYTQPDWYDQHGSAWDHEASFGGVHTGPNKSSDFHTYGVEWNENAMNFYFDDQRVASYNRPREISQTQAMYLIINLAIGGWATDGGDPIEVTADNPAWLECDWVRVYQKKASVPQTVRLLSVAEGLCMVSQGNTVVLGSNSDPNAYVNLENLGGNVYRVNFGSKVLEIPNESTAPGTAAGLWDWNGKNHQKVVFEPQSGFSSTVVRLKMLHSGHYLRSDGTNVIQDWNTSWPWNQNWKVIFSDADLPVATDVKRNGKERNSQILSVNKTSMIIKSEEFTVCQIFNLNGRIIKEMSITGITEFDLKDLSSGTYLLRITNKKTSFQKIFTINR